MAADHVSGVRAMLARVQRLERSCDSPFIRDYGSLDAFEASCRAGIAEGLYDPTDMPVVIAAIRRWTEEGAWLR